jgi:preprotein translocase subunit SecG
MDMRKLILPVVITAIVIAVVVYAVNSTSIGASAYDQAKGRLFSERSLINWILAVATLFFLATVVASVLTLANQRRRKGRNEVRLLLAKWSYGASLAAKTCGDAILNTIKPRTFSELADVPVARLVIDHLADHSFNIKLYRYLRYRLERESTSITSNDLLQIVASIESWKGQREAVTKKLSCYVQTYAGVERETEFKRALYFLRRREKYFDGVFDGFVIDVKDTTISALSCHLSDDVEITTEHLNTPAPEIAAHGA